MRFIFGIVPALLLALFVSACSSTGKHVGKGKGLTKNKKGKPVAEVAKGEVIGVIELVNPEQKYVLVRCDQLPAFTNGTELASMDALGTPAKLTVTPEHKGFYLTADIKSGNPHVGDLVSRKAAAAAKPAEPKVTPNTPPPPATPAPVTPPLPEIPKQAPAAPPLPQAGENSKGAPAAPVFEPVVK